MIRWLERRFRPVCGPGRRFALRGASCTRCAFSLYGSRRLGHSGMCIASPVQSYRYTIGDSVLMYYMLFYLMQRCKLHKAMKLLKKSASRDPMQHEAPTMQALCPPSGDGSCLVDMAMCQQTPSREPFSRSVSVFRMLRRAACFACAYVRATGPRGYKDPASEAYRSSGHELCSRTRPADYPAPCGDHQVEKDTAPSGPLPRGPCQVRRDRRQDWPTRHGSGCSRCNHQHHAEVAQREQARSQGSSLPGRRS
jgi:hypothetical protein